MAELKHPLPEKFPPWKETLETAIQSHYWPGYEDTVDYTDGLGMTHHLTIRAVTAEEFIRRYQARSTHLADIKAVPLLVKAESISPKADRETKACPIHGQSMTKRFAKESGKPYWAHNLPNSRKLCFGRPEAE